MALTVESLEVLTSTQLPCSRRPCLIAVITATLVLVVLGLTVSAHPASLATSRRHALEKDIVEMIGKSPVIDGFNCFLDTSQATLRLAGIVMVARTGPAACADRSTTRGQARCSATINVVFFNFAILASLIAMSISDCSRTLVVPAACAAGVTGTITGIDLMAASVSGIIASCNLWWEKVRVPPTGVTTTKAPLSTTRTRKMFTTPAATPPALPFPTQVPAAYWWNNNAQNTYQSAITTCVVFLGQAFLFIGRAIIVTLDASKFCTPETQVTAGGRKHCTIDMFTLVASMSLCSQFIAAATPSCSAAVSDSRTTAAPCAANIIGIVSSVSASASVLMKIDALCPSWLLTSTFAPPARLLAEPKAKVQVEDEEQ